MNEYKKIDIKFEKKILSPENLVKKIKSDNTINPIVFTNGCFDIIHRGHVTYLHEAKSLGKILIVALNTDESVKRLGKDINRPINNLANRCAVIAALESVDFVTYFDNDTPLELIKMIKPDILVKGGDWKINEIIGNEELKLWGGNTYSIPFRHQTSTTKLIEKIINK
jgi:rfaE bifunctional protein nucleotidyltransferase chain/domain